ncbi:hypothetical protein M3J09_009175 [Ascochyta lentis]
MKASSLLITLIIGPSIADAWICNCLYKKDPRRRDAGRICGSTSKNFCYNAKENINACILNHPITDKLCALAYYSTVNGQNHPDPDWVANCEHHVGGCPPST